MKNTKFDSRKYKLTKVVLITATVAFVLPPLLTYWFMPAPLILLTGTEWVSMCGSTLLLYFGGNVADKKLNGPDDILPSKTEGEK